MTKQKRKFFSAEFKLDTAKLVVDENYTQIEAAKVMKVGKSTISKWVNCSGRIILSTTDELNEQDNVTRFVPLSMMLNVNG